VTGARTAIRVATAADHQRLDGLFEGFDLGDARSYGAFLVAHAAALLPIEAALDAAGADRLIPGWADRRRGGMIRADLAALDLPSPELALFPPLDDDAACWGAAYVVEGSRLGGALLARRIAPGLPRAYLGTPQAKGAWRTFVDALDAALVGDDRIGRATGAARATFAFFEAAGRRQLEQSQR
jgi:heme oxygenase